MNSTEYLNRLNMPYIERGIPLPPPKKADERRKPKSLWPEYLSEMRPGDSFVTTYIRSQQAMNIGKWMGLTLDRREILDGDRPTGNVRVWLVSTKPRIVIGAYRAKRLSEHPLDHESVDVDLKHACLVPILTDGNGSSGDAICARAFRGSTWYSRLLKACNGKPMWLYGQEPSDL